MSMGNWNLFVKETLEKQKDRPDKGNMATFADKLTSKKGNIERKEQNESE